MRFPRRRAALLPDYEVNLSGLGQVTSSLFYFFRFIFTPLQVPVFTSVEGAGTTRTRTSTYPGPEIIQRTVDAFSRAQIVGWLAKAATPREMFRPRFDTQWVVRPVTIRHNLPRITVHIVQAPEIR